MSKKYAMDRIFEQVKQINDDWTELNQDLQRLSLLRADEQLKEVHKQYDDLRKKFANVITLGSGWKFFAEANGMAFPEDKESDE